MAAGASTLGPTLGLLHHHAIDPLLGTRCQPNSQPVASGRLAGRSACHQYDARFGRDDLREVFEVGCA